MNFLVVIVGVIACLVLLLFAFKLGLPLIGFSVIGPVAGSIAAGIQSTIGNVVAGSLFAVVQSLAMGGNVVFAIATSWVVVLIVVVVAGIIIGLIQFQVDPEIVLQNLKIVLQDFKIVLPDFKIVLHQIEVVAGDMATRIREAIGNAAGSLFPDLQGLAMGGAVHSVTALREVGNDAASNPLPGLQSLAKGGTVHVVTAVRRAIIGAAGALN